MTHSEGYLRYLGLTEPARSGERLYFGLFEVNDQSPVLAKLPNYGDDGLKRACKVRKFRKLSA